jgi:tRNA threonylcarbamoyladenosine biosynthesis protein TsaB
MPLMSRSLAIETSGRVGSVALSDGPNILAEEQFPHGLQNAATILPIINSLCAAQSWKPADLRHIFVSIGPGSFTGLRIGITLAKTLSFATGALVVPVPTVRVLAENAPPEAINLIVVLDAKRGQIFTARFQKTESSWIEVEPAHLDTLSAMLARTPRPVHLLGEGISYHQTAFGPSDPSVIITEEQSWRARAGAVAKLGWELAQSGKFVDPFKLSPLYVRRPEAEEKFETNANQP